MKHEKDIFKEWVWGLQTDLISWEELYDVSSYGPEQNENIWCTFCGNWKSMRIVKRFWDWDHNEYHSICDNCVSKLYDKMFKKWNKNSNGFRT